MPATEDVAKAYRQLAQGYERQGDTAMRDRFLVLAAEAYQSLSKTSEADQARAHLLRLNPHHLLAPYGSMAQALQATDVRNYVDGLKRHYPPEHAAKLLRELGNHPAAPTPATSAPVHQTDPARDLKLEAARPVNPRPIIPNPLAVPAGPPRATRTAAGGEVYSLMPVDPNPSLRGQLGLRDRDEPLPGSWLCIVLFWLGLLAVLTWAAFTVARPFWI